MILTHQKLHFGDKCLIEKLIVQPPFRFVGTFPNKACFIHFSEGATMINSPSEQISLEQGESVLLKCGNYFSDLKNYGKSAKYEILAVHLYPDVLREIYKYELPSFVKAPETKGHIHKVVHDGILSKFVEGLYFYLDNPSLVSDELLVLKLKELLLLLVQTKNAESVVTLLADLFEPREQNIKDVVNSHLFSNLSIEDLASLTSLSLSTFNRTFQNLFNDTPANFIKRKRLERAKDLLDMTNLTISEIAFQTCFTDVAHFSRSFKEVHSCSPTAYRLAATKQKA